MICAQLLSCEQLFAAPWTIACQAPLSMEFSRQEYWRGLPFPSPRDLPNLHILHLLHWQADSLPPHHLGSFKKSELYKNAGDLDVSSSKFSGKSEARGLPDRPKVGKAIWEGPLSPESPGKQLSPLSCRHSPEPVYCMGVPASK